MKDIGNPMRLRQDHRPALPRLILMTDAQRLPDPAAAIARLPRGSGVILRHYGVPGRRALARRLAALCRRHGLRLLIAGDGRLAAASFASGAGGLHLPEHLARRGPGPWRLWRRPGWIVTAAAHSPRALAAAARAGADAVLLSPVFATESPGSRPPIGAVRFALWCRRSPLPVYALGGVGPGCRRRLLAGGAVGLAGIDMFRLTN